MKTAVMTIRFARKLWFLLAFSMIFISSCKKTSYYSFTKDIKIEILLSDTDGEDLFDPASYNYFNKDSIRIFYVINNQAIEILNDLVDAPRNFYINSVNQRRRMQLFPNHDASEEYPVTLIQFNENETDTIRCGFERKLNSIICTKVWYNEELVWQAGSSNQKRSFEIGKSDS